MLFLLDEGVSSSPADTLLGEGDNKIYILLTDTKTRFSKISRFVTRDPYNHVSIMTSADFENVYTFALVNPNGVKGGLKKENKDVLRGSRYTLYSILVDDATYRKVNRLLGSYEKKLETTRYSHKALVNSMFKKEIFKSDHETSMICSQFVLAVLDSIDVRIADEFNREASTIRPYEIIKSKYLKFEKRGNIK